MLYFPDPKIQEKVKNDKKNILNSMIELILTGVLFFVIAISIKCFSSHRHHRRLRMNRFQKLFY